MNPGRQHPPPDSPDAAWRAALADRLSHALADARLRAEGAARRSLPYGIAPDDRTDEVLVEFVRAAASQVAAVVGRGAHAVHAPVDVDRLARLIDAFGRQLLAPAPAGVGDRVASADRARFGRASSAPVFPPAARRP